MPLARSILTGSSASAPSTRGWKTQWYADHPEVHEALITETRHFGVLLEIPRLQIKGLIKPDKLPVGRWVYEAFILYTSRCV